MIAFGTTKGFIGWFSLRKVEEVVIVKSGSVSSIRQVYFVNNRSVVVFLQGENEIYLCELSNPLKILGSYSSDGIIMCLTPLPELNCLAFAAANTTSLIFLSLTELKVIHTMETNISMYFIIIF